MSKYKLFLQNFPIWARYLITVCGASGASTVERMQLCIVDERVVDPVPF